MNDVNKATAIEALVGSGVDWTYYHGEDRLVWNDKNVSLKSLNEPFTLEQIIPLLTTKNPNIVRELRDDLSIGVLNVSDCIKLHLFPC